MGQLFSNLQQSQQNAEPNPDNPETTWWCRLLARIVACVGAFIALILSIFVMISVYPICIGAGILQMFAAFIVLVFEAPICCQFLDITKPIATFAERRTYLQKAILFCVLAIPPLAMCFGLNSLFGCGLIFAGGVIYGLMALGKKADREQMMEQAGSGGGIDTMPKASDDTKTNLIQGERTDPTNPFAAGSAQQAAGQYAGNYATQYTGQHVASQFSN